MNKTDSVELTPERKREIRERCKKATKGPWKSVDRFKMFGGANVPRWEIADAEDKEPFWIARVLSENDAEFFKHARTDVPALLAEIDRLERHNANWHVFKEQRQRIAELESLNEKLVKLDSDQGHEALKARARIAELDTERAAERQKLSEVTAERDQLREALEEAIDGFGINHEMSCVSQPPWDQDRCDCGREEFLKRCAALEGNERP